jgi:hypothetical protein
MTLALLICIESLSMVLNLRCNILGSDPRMLLMLRGGESGVRSC